MVVGYIDPDFPNPMGPGDATIVIYGYRPSAALAILAITLFGLNLVAVSVQILRLRLWSYVPIFVACVLEIVGYSFRYLSSHVDPYRVIFFVVQYFCITVAPVFIAASMYVYLSRLATRAAVEKFRTGWAARLGPRTVFWIFITADVVCTILQINGAAMIGVRESNHQDPTTANDILIGGLAAQTLAISIFLVLLIGLVAGVVTSGRETGMRIPPDVKRCMFALCIAGGLIATRTIFRLCESAQGVFGYLSTHEVFFGVLEAMPIIVAVAIFAVWTPAPLIAHPAVSSLFLATHQGADQEKHPAVKIVT